MVKFLIVNLAIVFGMACSSFAAPTSLHIADQDIEVRWAYSHPADNKEEAKILVTNRALKDCNNIRENQSRGCQISNIGINYAYRKGETYSNFSIEFALWFIPWPEYTSQEITPNGWVARRYYYVCEDPLTPQQFKRAEAKLNSLYDFNSNSTSPEYSREETHEA